jgi:adenylylsulfate kinase
MNEKKIILFIGLPGAGKTTLADMVHAEIGGARVNADQVRASISNDLGFSMADRRVQAARMGALAALAISDPPLLCTYSEAFLARLNKLVVIDFVCPTRDTLNEFMGACKFHAQGSTVHVIWMNTIKPSECRFQDTAIIYEEPEEYSIGVNGWHSEEKFKKAAAYIIQALNLKVKA